MTTIATATKADAGWMLQVDRHQQACRQGEVTAEAIQTDQRPLWRRLVREARESMTSVPLSFSSSA
jgi:hypothetical protein